MNKYNLSNEKFKKFDHREIGGETGHRKLCISIIKLRIDSVNLVRIICFCLVRVGNGFYGVRDS